MGHWPRRTAERWSSGPSYTRMRTESGSIARACRFADFEVAHATRMKQQTIKIDHFRPIAIMLFLNSFIWCIDPPSRWWVEFPSPGAG